MNINLLNDLFSFINKAFEFINENFFDSKLAPCVIYFNEAKSNVLGSFEPNSWIVDNQQAHAITIKTSYLLNENNSLLDILNTLFHEMLHYEAKTLGLSDTSNNGKKHNTKFKALGEAKGLKFENYSDKYGWSDFTFGNEINEILNEFILENKISNEKIYKLEKAKNKAVKKFFKYTCMNCKTNIKAELDKKIVCGDCMEPFNFNDKIPELHELLE